MDCIILCDAGNQKPIYYVLHILAICILKPGVYALHVRLSVRTLGKPLGKPLCAVTWYIYTVRPR